MVSFAVLQYQLLALGTGDTGCIQHVGLPYFGISAGSKTVTGHKLDLGTLLKEQLFQFSSRKWT